jgi:hypothetical protein
MQMTAIRDTMTNNKLGLQVGGGTVGARLSLGVARATCPPLEPPLAGGKHRTEDRAPSLALDISYSTASMRPDQKMVRQGREGVKRDSITDRYSR